MLSATLTHMSDQKITIDTRLALQWHTVDKIKSAAQTDFNNEATVQLLEVLETQQISKIASSTTNQSSQTDMARLESKIDLLLMFFSRHLLSQNFKDIPNYDVTLSADMIIINTSELVTLNEMVELNVFFNQNCPEPLLLSGKFVESKLASTLKVDFHELGIKTQTYIEKYIFRLHRNEVARIKSL